MDFRIYYDRESYLFDTVRSRFESQGYLSAFDFFCIVIWKAERAKSRIAKTLRKIDPDLNLAVYNLTRGIAQSPDGKGRLRFLLEEEFHLPMASAILTVLYPKEFTVYDRNVSGQLEESYKLKNQLEELDELKKLKNMNEGNFEKLWLTYEKFIEKVKDSVPNELSLRDKDRYLTGKSFYEQLTSDIDTGFPR